MATDKERRSCDDRRLDDYGPPRGWKERRRRTERRIPKIEEQVISESEWLLYFGAVAPATPSITPAIEIASTILDKVRD